MTQFKHLDITYKKEGRKAKTQKVKDALFFLKKEWLNTRQQSTRRYNVLLEDNFFAQIWNTDLHRTRRLDVWNKCSTQKKVQTNFKTKSLKVCWWYQVMFWLEKLNRQTSKQNKKKIDNSRCCGSHSFTQKMNFVSFERKYTYSIGFYEMIVFFFHKLSVCGAEEVGDQTE